MQILPKYSKLVVFVVAMNPSCNVRIDDDSASFVSVLCYWQNVYHAISSNLGFSMEKECLILLQHIICGISAHNFQIGTSISDLSTFATLAPTDPPCCLFDLSSCASCYWQCCQWPCLPWWVQTTLVHPFKSPVWRTKTGFQLLTLLEQPWRWDPLCPFPLSKFFHGFHPIDWLNLHHGFRRRLQREVRSIRPRIC